MTTAASHIKKLLSLEFFDGYLGLIEPIETLIKERDDALQFRDQYFSTLNDVATNLGDPGASFASLPSEVVKLNSTIERLELLTRPDTTQPQLSEIRYVLHGDIQPCSVLYSDETTTLLRLDEGDVMCETDTIEWSDSVTYRCQELLRSARVPVSGSRVSLNTVKIMAQLVRDERILLNDNADEAYFRDEVKPCVTAVVPAPPPFPRGVADHNNPYVHTNELFTEEAMRSHGWTNEALVSCGHGHYAPMQYPADAECRCSECNTPTDGSDCCVKAGER